ncbi:MULTISPECIES: S41 family peptidase [Sphingobacterium]|uniref:S41 family peptidase n=1 Tax=Sphingobacterium TaxID=28453 RepID=UPI0013DAA227|nr:MULTISPECIES: S41 family peptidase [unclassified Sphingobacterium]
MKHILYALGLSLVFQLSQAQTEVAFMSHPCLSPDSKVVVFSYEGDLWRVPTDGGVALRLTGMTGSEVSPRISPDGKWLAFSADQNGNMDVYIMPLEGGEIKQMTHHDGMDEVDSWSWDSQTIYFTSSRYNRFSSYSVSINGGTAKRLFDHYFNTIHNVVETPSGEWLFNDSWESMTAANRKRYKGAFNPDILSYNPKDKKYKQYTDYEGKDFWSSVDRMGNIYFASDEANNEYNLHTFIQGKKTALTHFETSIKRPLVSANGEKVIFEKDYKIFVYDVASKKAIQPKIALSRNAVLDKKQDFDVKDNISDMDVAADGRKLAFVSRGELFVGDIEGKFLRKISSQGERIVEVKWMKDNKTLLYNQTVNGYLNWFTISADGKGLPKQITDDLRNNRDVALNKDRSQAVYLSGRDEVRLLNLADMKSRLLVKDEIWAFQNSTPSFSPDSEYVLFTAYRNFEQDIFVHHVKTNKTTNLTNTGISEVGPVWSPDGKYIYFASNRTKPSYPTGMLDAKIYRMALDKFDKEYRANKFDELFKDDSKPKPDSSTVGKKGVVAVTKKDSVQKLAMVQINTDGLLDRVTQISPGFGTQSNPVLVKKGEKTYVFYYSNHAEGKGAIYRTVLEPFTPNKTEKVVDGGVGSLIEVGGKFFVLSRGAIQKYNLEANKLEKVEVSYKFQRNLSQEFKQMFYEAWAGIEENFYDEQFHGVDWKAVKKRYEAYLPYVNNRADLRVLLNDMLGELNASHLGFNSTGAEERKGFAVVSNEVGVEFSKENPFKVSRIIAQGAADLKGIDIQSGDELLAVNGVSIDQSRDRDAYFAFPSLQEELSLLLSRGGKEILVQVRPQGAAQQRDRLYNEWIKDNKRQVDQSSGNRIAYTHMKNMGGDQLQQFLLDMAEQENNKDAIILDLRFNTGGNVHDEVLRFLSQRPYLQWQYRGGKRAPQSNFAPAAKPIVLLINEQSLSDAEMTAAGFKALNLGKIIGTETYRWIIFTSTKGLVDGSMYRVPAWGCYTLDGKDLEMTGVAPDIYVKNTVEDREKGRDPQLERAIQEILKELK